MATPGAIIVWAETRWPLDEIDPDSLPGAGKGCGDAVPSE